MNATHTPTPLEYGVQEIKWDDAVKLGFHYAVRTLDPLTHEINEGSRTLTYCCTRQQAEFIVRAVKHEELLGLLKEAAEFLKDGQLLKAEIKTAIAKAEAGS